MQNEESHKQEVRSMIQSAMDRSWEIIAPYWPLQNLVAVNPLAGFEHLPFKEGLAKAELYFQQPDLPPGMHAVNRLSIKWLNAYFDEGQSTISVPMQQEDLWVCVAQLLLYDKELPLQLCDNREWLESLPTDPMLVIEASFYRLGIASSDFLCFLTLVLTTLPGFSAYVKYQLCWHQKETALTQSSYFALRLVLMCLLWPQAKTLLDWHAKAKERVERDRHEDVLYDRLVEAEEVYKKALLKKLESRRHLKLPRVSFKAQFIFCMDVRSEPFRRALEQQGLYETFGYAGFFGLPVTIEAVTGVPYPSCPALIKPIYRVSEQLISHRRLGRQHFASLLKQIYYSAKYTFSTPLGLAESVGLLQGFWMALKALFPRHAAKLKQTASEAKIVTRIDVSSIPTGKQVDCAFQMLRAIGLLQNFSPLVILCGHGSTSTNNPYASGLHCGACGGHHGGPNGQAMATVLNDPEVREALRFQGIDIPETTFFIGAEHDTTTDEVFFYESDLPSSHDERLRSLKLDLLSVRVRNNQQRALSLGLKPVGVVRKMSQRAHDWSQVRPEWGLAGNAALILAPRSATRDLDLEGRCFLHSYNWEADSDGSVLTALLSAPMVVAQWISSQYLFSTADNVAFGAGNKITANVTSKIGIMQGNASDLMTGLSLQSVYASDDTPYHQPMRLLVVVYAPRERVERIISEKPILKRLVGNGWVNLVVIDPDT